MDETYMQLALKLAENGAGFTNPNPMVGAVIVKRGKVIGQGFHQQCGSAHAEVNAITNCCEPVQDAVLYVTLEPCCHFGKTPPCTDAIIKSGIKKVVVGAKDPSPLVSGKGIELLRQNNIEVIEGILETECLKLNEVFFHFIKTNMPFVIMKYAMSMDGKIAAYTGHSKWITGIRSREQVHKDRHRYAAIMVGVNTVINDDPLLTCRIANGKNPVRIVCDTHLRTPLLAAIVTTAKEVPTIIATCCKEKEKQQRYLEHGCNIMEVTANKNHIDLKEVMTLLAQQGIDSVLIEGGGTLNWSALQSGIVNKVQAYIAPKILGGADAKSPVMGLGADSPDNAFSLINTKIISLGKDFLIESEVRNHVYRNC